MLQMLLQNYVVTFLEVKFESLTTFSLVENVKAICKSRSVTHLLKTSRKSQFWLFEYDTPFERGRHPLYKDTKIIFLSQS